MADKNSIETWIAGLAANLQTVTPDDEKNKTELFKLFKTSVSINTDILQTTSAQFSFENIVPVSLASLAPALQQQVNDVLEGSNIITVQNAYKVFQRETPVRNSLAQRSVPGWAGGAAVDKTIGPLTNIDGRNIWFDFFKVEKLVAIYLSGATMPAIIFNIDVIKIFDNNNIALQAPVGKEYTLANNSSIWINSTLLASNAPAGKYTGLTIQSGTIILTEPTTIIGNYTTIPALASVTVQLVLKQQIATDADMVSPYGMDARAATFKLPDHLTFVFNNANSTITSIGSAAWNLFKQASVFDYNLAPGFYNPALFSIFIPLVVAQPVFTFYESLSTFVQLKGSAPILDSFWNLPAADLDLTHISPAAGIGALAVLCAKGLTISWTGLQKGIINLNNCIIIAHPEGIAIGSVFAGNFNCRQSFKLWQDEKNPYASTLNINFGKQFSFEFFSTVNGYEIVQAAVNAIVESDRPVDVAAKPLPTHTKGSYLALTAFEKHRTITLYDNNMLQDNYVPPVANVPFEMATKALALSNALFTTTPVTGIFLTGELTIDWKKMVKGNLYLSLGIYKYIPILPDPYIANISIFQQNNTRTQGRFPQPIMLLLCQNKWGVRGNDLPDDVTTNFHLLPLAANQNANPLGVVGLSATTIGQKGENEVLPQNTDVFNLNTPLQFSAATSYQRGLDWSKTMDNFLQDNFSLLDVSSRADQMGISFGQFKSQRESASLLTLFGVETSSDQLQTLYSVPFKIENVQVTSPGLFVRSFTLPQIAWEPVYNKTAFQVEGDPPLGMNYYPDDGGPARFFNNSFQYVPLAPRPVVKDIIRRYKADKKNLTIAYFTLPFGLKALAVMSKHKQGPQAPSIEINRPVFKNNLRGGIQMQFNAGKLLNDKYPMFNGATIQLANIVDKNDPPKLSGTLGSSVSAIFNKDFKPKIPLVTSRGVPLTRIDFSGYGASTFSDWANPDAQIAATSQVKFDVFVGRTAHEVVQVRSIVYPWGIHVVRTIVLYRTNTGYVYRIDTGWQAESDGKFDFTYHIKTDPNPNTDVTTAFPSPYHIHPGVVKGLFNIKNIVEINTPKFLTTSTIKNGDWYLDENNNAVQNTTGDFQVKASLQKIVFDSDIEIENVVQGHINIEKHEHGLVSSKQVIGYVQIEPTGVPISSNAFTALLLSENGSIGGSFNAIIDINNSKQRMRLNGFDVNNENNNPDSNTVFVVAARGSVLMPKEGSWSMVKHNASSGEVSPLAENITVPLIRIGDLQIQPDGTLQAVPAAATQLLRIADPIELLKVPDLNTINYGFLQNTGTQKTLFLTPVFQHNVAQLLSKTPPLFADAYHVINSKGIFPNIGDAVTSFKDAHPLALTNFLQAPGGIADAGKAVFQLMQVDNNIKDIAQNLQDQAYTLLKLAPDFDLPDQPLNLINEDFLKVYIEYKNSSGNKLGFDINSLANNTAEKWNSRLNNIAMVVDLGSFKRLMTIRGDFNAKKGSESNYGGTEDGGMPAKIEFSSALETVIAILQILQDLSGGDYQDAIKKGLQIAMSNNAGTWEYKFEAVKEIPVVRFPFGLLYNDPEQPLKLEASLRVGVYFNAALMVTTDAKKILPTVGAFLGFYGQVTVMCFSLAAATIYAVGQVTLDIAADTAKGPSLHMKFGFGVQLVIGLPVVGNVSVLYMAGVEIYKDKDVLAVSAFLLFKGHAELLGGIVGITITIEAKGTIKRVESEHRTDCIAQVIFAIDISIFLVINIDFSVSWEEQRQIA